MSPRLDPSQRPLADGKSEEKGASSCGVPTPSVVDADALAPHREALPSPYRLELRGAQFDRCMIQRSDGLEVLLLPGWCRSVCVTA